MGDEAMFIPRVPTRYEDIEQGFRGRLKPNRGLNQIVQRARKSCLIGSGIRFAPIFGRSGAGKTSAVMELSTHLSDVVVSPLPHTVLTSRSLMLNHVQEVIAFNPGRFPVFVVDQYEEVVAERENIPTQFLEALSLLDRGELNTIPCLFVWLTTSEDFRDSLIRAARRNERILQADHFVIEGPGRDEWPGLIHELFEFHNAGQQLANYQVLESTLKALSIQSPTIGHAIREVVGSLETEVGSLHDLSDYMVIILWPVTDMVGIQKVVQFTTPNTGYQIDWRAWTRQVCLERNYPYDELNKARLYFDMRLVPIQVADLHALMRDLLDTSPRMAPTHLDKFKVTHFFRLVSDTWGEVNFKMMLERKESARAKNAADWYAIGENRPPVLIGRRLAAIFHACGLPARHEVDITSSVGKVRADVLVERKNTMPKNAIIELKVFAPETTMPSTIAEQVRVTMRRHAQLLGLLKA